MHQLCTNDLCRISQIDMIDLGTGRHHRANRPFRQLQYATDHHALASMEDVLMTATVKHVGNLFAHFISTQGAPAKQAHHRMGGALAHGPQALHAFLAARTGNLVEYFDQDREADGGVQITFRDMKAQALGSQAEADHHQEAQAQHDHRRVTVDEVGQRFAGDDHQTDREHHGDHHHRQMLNHAYRGNHRVQGKHRVEHDNLRHNRPEHGIAQRR